MGNLYQGYLTPVSTARRYSSGSNGCGSCLHLLYSLNHRPGKSAISSKQANNEKAGPHNMLSLVSDKRTEQPTCAKKAPEDPRGIPKQPRVDGHTGAGAIAQPTEASQRDETTRKPTPRSEGTQKIAKQTSATPTIQKSARAKGPTASSSKIPSPSDVELPAYPPPSYKATSNPVQDNTYLAYVATRQGRPDNPENLEARLMEHHRRYPSQGMQRLRKLNRAQRIVVAGSVVLFVGFVFMVIWFLFLSAGAPLGKGKHGNGVLDGVGGEEGYVDVDGKWHDEGQAQYGDTLGVL